MKDQTTLDFLKGVVNNMPEDWLTLTTHRLDIYNESLAKTEFLGLFEQLYHENNAEKSALYELPTAYDYIRLGHPLSSVLEWAVAKEYDTKPENVICFQSQITPILAVLRKNLLENKRTRIVYQNSLPNVFNENAIQEIYNYNFELLNVDNLGSIPTFDGSTVLISNQENITEIHFHSNVDFYVNVDSQLGSIIFITENNSNYISEIQHVRRRETIAMTPENCHIVLQKMIGESTKPNNNNVSQDKASVLNSIKEITTSNAKAVVGSSGLSIQYAIVMGLIDDAFENHKGKNIKIVVPPNCYGGTNDQARRVAACIGHVEIMDLPVDGNHNMVESVDMVLNTIAELDAVPYIIAEIPTNPRVEVPELEKLRDALSKKRMTKNGEEAIEPVFILDQTFCPNVHFLGDDNILSTVKTISYVSGSKFPSGGKCTAGYCTANKKAAPLMDKIEKHLTLCDNEATALQYEILANQMPSMNQRIADAYKNTREFVNYIKETLPDAKINFVSEELAEQGFTPSVFSLDLPTKGDTHEERENYKRELNLKLINMMIEEIPHESKYCVSYGQLKGCYWTIPATSTQGTTKEADKDYIARVALSGNMNLEKHKAVFKSFVESI